MSDEAGAQADAGWRERELDRLRPEGWWQQYEERAWGLDILAGAMRTETPEAAKLVRGAADDIRTLVDGLRQYEKEAMNGP